MYIIKNKNGPALSLSKGFTLIEVIIYIALFTLLIGSGFVTAYQLIEGGNALNQKTINQEEVNFVLRKISWVLNGVATINSPSSGYSNTLTVTRYDGTVLDVRLSAGKIELKDGVAGSFVPITTDNVKVTTLQFQYVPAVGTAPAGIIASTTISGYVATTTKYIRK